MSISTSHGFFHFVVGPRSDLQCCRQECDRRTRRDRAEQHGFLQVRRLSSLAQQIFDWLLSTGRLARRSRESRPLLAWILLCVLIALGDLAKAHNDRSA
jgi:hypothetical protein